MVERYYLDDGKTEIGVLVAPGYGGGWSTWWDAHNCEQRALDLAVDKRIIEFFLPYTTGGNGSTIHFPAKDKPKLEQFLESIGYHGVFVDGIVEAVPDSHFPSRVIFCIQPVPVGNRFWISEYDGYEELHIVDAEDEYWYLA